MVSSRALGSLILLAIAILLVSRVVQGSRRGSGGALTGLFLMIAFIGLMLFWGRGRTRRDHEPVNAMPPRNPSPARSVASLTTEFERGAALELKTHRI